MLCHLVDAAAQWAAGAAASDKYKVAWIVQRALTVSDRHPVTMPGTTVTGSITGGYSLCTHQADADNS